MKIYIETYGCSSNQADSEMMAGLLSERGYDITQDIKKSDVVVINTCFVKSPTENRIIDRIKQTARAFPGKGLVVAGCMPEVMKNRIYSVAPRACLVGTHKITKICDAVEAAVGGKSFESIGISKEHKAGIEKKRKNSVINIVPVSSGCLGACTYCCVRLAKGMLRSYPETLILHDIKHSLDHGCKEIWLTSQDCSCYGADSGKNIAGLVKKVTEIKGDFRVRIGMMNPGHIKPIMVDLINAYRNPKVYKFLHVPVQSGSDRVLRLMKRRYTVRDFEQVVSGFRKAFPGITIITDVIVGFPGETENDFKKTFDLIKKLKPDFVNLSRFGARPGTEAAGMKQLDGAVIKDRSKRLRAVIKTLSVDANRKFLGKQNFILISERGKKPNQWVGRNEFYKPVIVETKTHLMGKSVIVKITGLKETHLNGKILK
jgi:threonylcarbamoyladenosine tRNA methylthiotransferase CDKAL1